MSLHSAWHLLYHRLPWLFDFVSGRASHGRWREWGSSAIFYLERGRVLELGHGPGHLLLLLKEAGYQPVGIDLSAGMGRQASRRMRRAGMDVPLVRCRAQVLPFQARSFDEVVATFPTDDVLELSTLREVSRLIPRGGRMVMVAGAQTKGVEPDPHFVEWLQRLIGDSADPALRKESVFFQAGLRARIQHRSVKGSPVILVIAENRPGRYGWVNSLPKVDAGQDLHILSRELADRILVGAASDPDGDPLKYRWVGDEVVLSDWNAVGPDGKMPLRLEKSSPLPVGAHTLILEVSDPYETAQDKVTLTIGNSPPNILTMGGGEYEINTPVVLQAQVADYDGDILNFAWRDGEETLARGSVQTVHLGGPVDLPTCEIKNLDLGDHPLRLEVSDGVNPPVSAHAAVVIRDTIPPELAPLPTKKILWPPDHSMVPVMIRANALDNSRMPVRISARVNSNEPEEGLGDWDIGPDWRVAEIDEEQGIIALQLRAERSGRGNDREYTVTITATDQAGNASTRNVKIFVPHSLTGNMRETSGSGEADPFPLSG